MENGKKTIITKVNLTGTAVKATEKTMINQKDEVSNFVFFCYKTIEKYRLK